MQMYARMQVFVYVYKGYIAPLTGPLIKIRLVN